MSMEEKSINNSLQNEEEHPETKKPTWRPQDADREYIKYSTRTRVRNAVVPPQAVFKPAKPTPSILDQGQKKVAVYARVSTKSTEQVSSIENQTKYYTEKIHKTPDWELQEIYSDEGKSGTSTKRRTEFRRMIADAGEKKMDLILCASVSRFARNISDLIEEVRKLKTTNPSHPVGVYFETEDIYSLDNNIDERLQMHALFAEWESRNKSRRMILSYDQRICTGQYPVSDLLGYRHTIDGDLIIEEDEAKTVRFIFLSYISGRSFFEIADILTEKGRKTLKGRTVWNAGMVKAIMENERRWGDLEARKRIVIDFKDRITVKNTDLRDTAFIPNHHEGIVSPEIAKAACMLSCSRSYAGAVPDVSVIDSGAFKGFVSISPTWGGIDNDSFLKICKNVYSDDEYNELRRKADILTGKEHSNVLSMDFAGYEVPHGVVFMTKTSPQLTISQKSIQLNAVCRTRLSECEYVEILYHPILEMVAVRKCEKDNPSAVLWKNEKGGISITANAFANAIFDKMDWIKKYKFRFRGISRERGAEKVLMFFLEEPQIIVGKYKKQIDAEHGGDPDTTARYIPYQELQSGESETESAMSVAYPDSWRNRFGVTLEIRKRRNELIDTITDSDICASGRKVVNPIIGELPSITEIEDELNQIYMSM